MSDEGSAVHLVSFRRGEASFAVDVRRVRQAVRPKTMRRLPGAPAYIPGGIVVDGRLEVLVDPALALLSGDAPDPAINAGEPPARALLVSGGGPGFALVADVVDAVSEVPIADVQDPPPFVGGSRRAAILGMIVRENREILLLDPDFLLDEAAQDELGRSDLGSP